MRNVLGTELFTQFFVAYGVAIYFLRVERHVSHLLKLWLEVRLGELVLHYIDFQIL